MIAVSGLVSFLRESLKCFYSPQSNKKNPDQPTVLNNVIPQ